MSGHMIFFIFFSLFFILSSFYFYDFLINILLPYQRLLKDWQRLQDVCSHDNNSISCFSQCCNALKKAKTTKIIFRDDSIIKLSIFWLKKKIWKKHETSVEVCRQTWRSGKTGEASTTMPKGKKEITRTCCQKGAYQLIVDSVMYG